MNETQLAQFRLGADCFHADDIPFQCEPFFEAGYAYAMQQHEAFMQRLRTLDGWQLAPFLPRKLFDQCAKELDQRLGVTSDVCNCCHGAECPTHDS